MSRWLLTLFVLAVAGSFALSGWLLFARFHDTTARRNANTQAWHSVICYFEALTLANKSASAEQKVQSIRVLDHVLELVEAKPCP